MTLPVAHRTTTSRIAHRAFSLIELLVVITIIAVVIAITVPALSGARELARKSSTQGKVQSLTAAIGTFSNDNDRPPGYFSQDEMGDTQNVTRGLTAMQNIMLDLIGGPVEAGSSNPGLIEVGPIGGSTVDVDPALINVGSNAKGYYTPGAKDYQVVEGKVAVAEHQQLPEVVDAWGMPILAWVENDLASTMTETSVVDDFAQIVTPASSAAPARYYWAQNSGVLASTGLGPRRIDQRTASLIGMDAASNLPDRLAAFLGSPSSMVKADANFRSILPRAGRGAVVFQSAGTDRVYLSSEDKGFGAVGGEFFFGRNFTPNNSITRDGQYLQKDGTQGSIDIIDGFDDILSSAGR